MFQQSHRVPHIMKRHVSNKMPASLLFFDTETRTKATPELVNVSRQVLNFGYAYAYRYENGKKSRESWCRFTTSEQFFKFVKVRTDDKRPLYVFAHNLGFDLTIVDFWNWSEEYNFHVEYHVLSDPPTFIIGRLNNRKIVFIDTLNYWRQSLAAIGASIGLAKLTRPNPKSSKATWDRYARRDVEVLSLAVDNLMRYVKENDLGQFGLSAASMAMSTFKHRFMKHEIYIHDNRKALECERKSYYGGFTHCYYVGRVKKCRIYKLDVNSMYPYCMRGLFPCKLIQVDADPSLLRVRSYLRTKGVIAHVEISSSKHSFPTYVRDRLCYCIGQFPTYLCGPELSRALNNGCVTKILTCCIYEMAPLFRDYIDFFWKERKRFKADGNDVYQYFVKLFMNMLYGKFGQLGYDNATLTTECLRTIYASRGLTMPGIYEDAATLLTEFVSEVDWKPIGLNRPLTLRRINNNVQVKVPNGEHNESFPGIAGYVTSYARELLLTYIRIAGSRNVYYCDTDSLFVNRLGYNNLGRRDCISERDLGKLKLEGLSNGAEFWCPKDYVFDNRATRKGIRKDAKQISDTVFEQIQFEGIKSVLKRGYNAFIDIETITKRNSRKFNKGRLGKDGWVTPFILPGDTNRLDLD